MIKEMILTFTTLLFITFVGMVLLIWGVVSLFGGTIGA